MGKCIILRKHFYKHVKIFQCLIIIQDILYCGLFVTVLSSLYLWETSVYFLCVVLAVSGLTQEGLFRVNGNVKVVEQLRWKFESGVPVELGRDGDVCAAASLLKLFLRELPESVITSTLQPRFLQLFQGQYTKSF